MLRVVATGYLQCPGLMPRHPLGLCDGCDKSVLIFINPSSEMSRLVQDHTAGKRWGLADPDPVLLHFMQSQKSFLRVLL